jgi:hypothetical protein
VITNGMNDGVWLDRLLSITRTTKEQGNEQ